MSQNKMYESGVIDGITGEGIRPGGLEVTGEAMEFCKFPEKSKILDIGCGKGTTIQFIENNYKLHAKGIDKSQKLIDEGRENNPKLDLSLGDGEFLDFPSHSFDGVFMECVLSIINRQEEALHEAYCVLKPGGKLIISDFFLKDPDPQQVLVAQKEAILAKNAVHESGECETENKRIPSEICLNGAFIMDALMDKLSDLGYEVLLWDDKTELLKSFVGQAIFQMGSIEEFWKSILPEDTDYPCFAQNLAKSKIGYFLLIAHKPV